MVNHVGMVASAESMMSVNFQRHLRDDCTKNRNRAVKRLNILLAVEFRQVSA